MTALHEAAMVGDLAQCQSLIDSGMDVNLRGNFQRAPLHLAAWHGHEAVCRILVDQGADVHVLNNFEQKTPLHYAALCGHEQVCRFLVAKDADYNARDDDQFYILGRTKVRVNNKGLGWTNW